MPLVCIGLSHRTAPVALRERLAFSTAELRRAYGSLRERRRATGGLLAEFAILSTCNRTEIYAAAAVGRRLRDVPPELVGLLRDRGVPDDASARHLYRFHGADAVRHLCRVAAGLESMVLGESEILGQVAAALALAAEEDAAGPVLDAAFHAALRAGRRARAETCIARSPVSVSSEAVRLLREVAGDLAVRRVLIVGTGKMGRLAGETLRSVGARELVVVSRTTAHAETLASLLGARPRPWHDLAAAIAKADLVLCSTSAPHAVVTHELVRTAVSARGNRPLVFVDIGVPRDVEPEVGTLPGVRLFDIDDLKSRIGENLDARRREVPAVERIVAEEVAAFEEWRRGAQLRPLLAAMRSRSEAIRRRELEQMLRRLGADVSPELREEIARFSEALVNKLLHEPTQRLRAERDPKESGVLARATRDLFGLSEHAASLVAADSA